MNFEIKSYGYTDAPQKQEADMHRGESDFWWQQINTGLLGSNSKKSPQKTEICLSAENFHPCMQQKWTLL